MKQNGVVSYGCVLCVLVTENVVSAMWNYMQSPTSQEELVKYLKANRDLRDERAAQVMLSVDRGWYCKGGPYSDGPESIGYGATISAPHMHAYALQKLSHNLVEGARALDVGSGSGYLTVCMALMVGKTGLVVGVEHMPELLNQSVENVKKDKPELYEAGRIKLFVGDGRKGHPEEAPYDAIHVGAAAKEIPQALLDQLKPGGRMVIPVGEEHSVQVMTIVDKLQDGRIVQLTDTSVRYVPLTDKEHQYNNFRK